jgi:hypothetical protein
MSLFPYGFQSDQDCGKNTEASKWKEGIQRSSDFTKRYGIHSWESGEVRNDFEVCFHFFDILAFQR